MTVYANYLVLTSFGISNAELPEKSYGADCRVYMPDDPTNRFKNVYV